MCSSTVTLRISRSVPRSSVLTGSLAALMPSSPTSRVVTWTVGTAAVRMIRSRKALSRPFARPGTIFNQTTDVLPYACTRSSCWCSLGCRLHRLEKLDKDPPPPQPNHRCQISFQVWTAHLRWVLAHRGEGLFFFLSFLPGKGTTTRFPVGGIMVLPHLERHYQVAPR